MCFLTSGETNQAATYTNFGPFDKIGVDVIKFSCSARGNQCAVVFMDYLTKWPEVFATQDQTSLTIAKLLVEKVISHHGVPAELL